MEHPNIRGLSEWRPLARGGLAVVWEASQLSLGRLVAVKVYEPALDEGGRRRFLREAGAAGRLSDHPGIVTVHDAGILDDDRPFLIMELCPGGSLTQWLKPENRPSEERIRQVGIRIADALAALHACGVLHRDVKPANILIDSYGHAGLADFGLAATADGDSAVDALGMTPAYAPPEAFRMQTATASGDVYSLAATLYALLAGSPPRCPGAAPVALEQWIEFAQRPISALPGVDRYLMDVLMTALGNDPAARPTAAKFRDQLLQVPTRAIQVRVPPVGAGHPSGSSSHRVAVPAMTAASEEAPGQVMVAEGPPRGRQRGAMALAAAMVTVVASGAAWLINEPTSTGVSAAVTQSANPGGSSSDVGPPPATESGPPMSTTTPGAGDSTDPGTPEEAIQVEDSADSAKPFETVPIQGTYRGGADTFVQVQRWEAGKWLTFPLSTKTDQSGGFTAYVELGQPGRYRLRVMDPDSGAKSEASVLVVAS